MIKIVSLSDIHIGNPRIDSLKLSKDFNEFVYPQLEDCDILMLAGDFFDNLLTMDNENSHHAITIISDFFRLAFKYKFKIRVLRGTFTHDRDQNKVFNSIHNNFKSVDYKYFDQVTFEYLKKENLKIVYLPDNLPYKNSDKCIHVIKEKMKSLNWDHINLVIGHGYFKHVLPPGIPKEPTCTFNINQFKDIVKGFLLFGHIHTYSAYRNMAYNGSFERFRHGEEESKGFLTLNITDNNDYRLTFIENTNATVFHTIHLYDSDIQLNIDKIEKYINKQIVKGFKVDEPLSLNKLYLRLIHQDSTIRNVIFNFFKDKYKNIIFSEDNLKKEKYDKITIETFIKEVESETIPTKDNIISLMSDFLKTDYQYIIAEPEIERLIKNITRK